MRHLHLRLPLVLLTVLVTVAGADVRGRVTDADTGAPVAGANVTAAGAAATTDADGRFFMASLPIGAWEITAELPGFRRAVQTSIVLAIGRSLDLEFTLNVGQMSEEVTVLGTAPLLQSTTYH